MATVAERLKILQLVDEGALQPEEAAQKLAALAPSSATPMYGFGSTHTLRVQVTDAGTGRTKVSVSVPAGLVRSALRMGARFAPQEADIDFDALVAAAQKGAVGKLVDLVNPERNERIEIFVE